MPLFDFDAASALVLKHPALCRKYQKNGDLLLRKAPFARLVRRTLSKTFASTATLSLRCRR
jgi:histone H3/H4